ncbi:MAG: trypsin-like peptidase domain-containing protein [Parcubacteria group bacterium]|nr:trypsin-like peptidase domain-containing protein [Parcubacteria group bacterium]
MSDESDSTNQNTASSDQVFKRVKAATVALAVVSDKVDYEKKPPYSIVGSGFCVHPRGIVVTCRHVLEGFMSKSVAQQIAKIPEDQRDKKTQLMGQVESITPHALFFLPDVSSDQLIVISSAVDIATAKTDFDLGMIRIHLHAAFSNGYPTVEIEDFEKVTEGMEIAVCGFPLGNHLLEQIGTITSSFSRGIVSSIIPSPGVPKEHLKGFQLNITATHGNSGGPVFSLRNGKVFGVLQRGIQDREGNLLPGLVKAEPIYPVLEHDLLERIVRAPVGQPLF